MEFFDVVNEHDEVIGQASRDECHANPALLHRTIHFTLIDRKFDKILLTIRTPELKYDGGKVCVMGEHLKAGESYKAAVIRGIREELGFVPTQYMDLGQHIFAYAKQRELVHFYLVDWNGEQLVPDPAEISELHWVTFKSLMEESRDYSEMTRYWIQHADWKAVDSPR